MNCWTSARWKRSTGCWPRRASPCSLFCRATGSRRRCCNGPKASPAARCFFAGVLLSHTLFFGSIAFTRFGGIFYNTASAVQSRAGGGFKLDYSAAGNQFPDAGRAGAAVRPDPALPPETARAGGQGPAHVLARHHAMGAVRDVFRPARRLHHQSAQLHASARQPVLDPSRGVPESGRVRLQPGLRNDPLRVPAVFAGRPAPVDHGARAGRPAAHCRRQILPRQLHLAGGDAGAGHAFLLSA